MKTKHMALLMAPLIIALVAAACGGSDGGDDEADIRTSKGLAVAALGANAVGGEGAGGSGDEAGFEAGVPVPQADVGTESRGAIAPESAPFSFPSPQESQTGVTVQGYGSASVDADSAVLSMFFGREVTRIEPPMPVEPEPDFEVPSTDAGVPEETIELGDPGTRSFQAEEITEADLQPVVDAIVAQGVSPDDVEFTVEPYYGGNAIIRVTVRDVDALEGIIDAVDDAASSLEEIFLSGPSVSYTVSDCAALEMAAMQAAVEDAQERGETFASALGVGLGTVVGASHYSYSPFGSPCDAASDGGYLMEGLAYAGGQSSEVQLIAAVAITFAIQ